MVTNCPPKYVGFQAGFSLRCLRVGLLVAVLGALSACGSLQFPYRAEVVQGNVVTKEQVQALRPGMPRQVVKEIMGTPLVTSMFHDNRWDYAFTMTRQGTEPQQRRVSLYFKDNQLIRIEGDVLPTEAEFAAGIDARKPSSSGLPLKATSEQLAQYPRPTNPIAQPAAEAPVRKNYPPLEASN
jgi:outer membrane protein assembly factor BamE